MITPTDVCCGSSLFDGGREQICCGKKVSSKSQFDSCCERNDGSVEEFNSSTHFCCNGAVAKGTQTACCYLRKNGKIVPQQYNTQNICCRFPYDELQTKINGQCIKLKG
uniref:Galaxin-like n=1 Tax=Heterorhabditis bacteriophora TaxID=37862 RepID=A0A1I7WP56_HETBA